MFEAAYHVTEIDDNFSIGHGKQITGTGQIFSR